MLEGFGGGDSATELAGRFFEGQVIAEAESEHAPVVVGQGSQHVLKVLPVPLWGEESFGVAVVLGVARFKRYETSGPAADIRGLIAGKMKQPRGEGETAVFIVGGPFEQADKDLAVGVTGQFGITQAAAQVVIDAGPVSFIDPAHDLRVALLKSGNQVVVGWNDHCTNSASYKHVNANMYPSGWVTRIRASCLDNAVR